MSDDPQKPDEIEEDEPSAEKPLDDAILGAFDEEEELEEGEIDPLEDPLLRKPKKVKIEDDELGYEPLETSLDDLADDEEEALPEDSYDDVNNW